jgi:hypothetical protein
LASGYLLVDGRSPLPGTPRVGSSQLGFCDDDAGCVVDGPEHADCLARSARCCLSRTVWQAGHRPAARHEGDAAAARRARQRVVTAAGRRGPAVDRGDDRARLRDGGGLHYPRSACAPFRGANSTGSVCARNSCPDVAAKSRLIRMIGSVGSVSMVVSVLVVMLTSIPVVGFVHCCQDAHETNIGHYIGYDVGYGEDERLYR